MRLCRRGLDRRGIGTLGQGNPERLRAARMARERFVFGFYPRRPALPGAAAKTLILPAAFYDRPSQSKDGARRAPLRARPRTCFFAEDQAINHSVACFYSRQGSRVYVHVNMKTLLFRLWARISRKLAGKPQQMELNLWTRRSTR
jgi:hypothetical protein